MFTYKIVQEAKQADITVSWVILHYRFVWFDFFCWFWFGCLFFFLLILYSSSSASTKCFVNTLVDVAVSGWGRVSVCCM